MSITSRNLTSSNRHATFLFGNEDTDTDSWDEGDDNPESFGPFPGQRADVPPSCSSPDVMKIDDWETGWKRRQFTRDILHLGGVDAFMPSVDQVNADEAETLERQVIKQIQSMRQELGRHELFLSDLFTQAARALSQFYCGNCTRDRDDMPFDRVSFSVPKCGEQRLRWHACRLADVMRVSDVLMTELSDDRLCDVGVGVSGRGDKYIVTIVK